jgi:hypothetical protein
VGYQVVGGLLVISGGGCLIGSATKWHNFDVSSPMTQEQMYVFKYNDKMAAGVR